MTGMRRASLLSLSLVTVAWAAGCPPPPCCETDSDCADLPTVGCEDGDEACYQPVCREGVCAYTCESDADCPLDEVCLRGSGAGGACVRPGGYPDGECPDPSPPAVPAPCDDDDQEDNDSRPEARPLAPDTYEFNLCPGDEDWFALSPTTPSAVRVDISFPGVGNVDLELYGADGTVLDASNGAGTTESVADDRVLSSTRYVRVFGPGLADAVAYELVVDHEGAACTDPFEPNDTAAQATTGYGNSVEARICEDDRDLFVVRRESFTDIVATVYFSHAEGDIDAQLIAPSGQVVADSNSTNDNEYISFFVGNDPGDYLLEVYGFQGATNRYSMQVNDPGNAFCGNGTLDPGEQCDDGNLVGGDGCSPVCTTEAVCGNGIVEFPEQCDDGNNLPGDGCSASCTAEADCGDGTVQLGEECDDGNFVDTDSCTSTCRDARCGDGITWAGVEQCDDGNLTGGDGCSAFCTTELPDCGNGVLDPGEGCDDGNLIGGDGCSPLCEIEAPCGNGTLDPGEECDDGNTTPGDGCSALCLVEIPAGWTCPPEYYNHESCDCGCGVIDLDCASGSAGVCQFNQCPTGFDPLPNQNWLCNIDQCGNGVVEPPEQCDDGNTQNGDGCNANCVTEGGTCGNGFIQAGEECDDGNTQNGDGCSSTCQVEPPAGWTCTASFYLDGTCDCGCDVFDIDCPTLSAAVCARDNCPPGFSPVPQQNPMCEEANVCGDGVVVFPEECDDGNTQNGDGCNQDCRLEAPTCGNGTLEPPEQCDDGNNVSGDGCNALCQVEDMIPADWSCVPQFYGDGLCDCGCTALDSDCPTIDPGVCEFINCDAGLTLPDDNRFCAEAPCGNGVLDPGEQCDDGNNVSGDGCSAGCLIETDCGNGILEPPEQCDDGNNQPGDGCSPFCTVEGICGDGVIQFPEQCDDGNNLPGDGCSPNCTVEGPTCGNGQLEPGEQCDDGNTQNGDGCSSTCQVEVPVGWTCPVFWFGDGICDCGCAVQDSDCPSLNASVCEFNNCPGGVQPVPDNNPLCLLPSCGNGMIEPPEQCDDGNTQNGDGCNANCQIEPACGNGQVEAGEQCDDGNTLPGDGCDENCLLEGLCGNFILDPGEECDDGNLLPGDGCSPECLVEFPTCGDGALQFPEECDDGNNQPGDGCDEDCEWEIPDAWVCFPAFYGSGNSCDCGCGALDPDCESADAQFCDVNNCPGGFPPVDDENYLCDIESCGNGVVEFPEECDDGNVQSGDGCNASCQVEPFCGNGQQEGSEECDDGNNLDGDGCSATCELEIPDEWTCSPFWFGDGICDCGCGAFDENDCVNTTDDACGFDNCQPPTTPNPTMNWICDFPECEDDLSEENDTFEDATFIGESFTNADLCPDDPDFYEFNIDAGFIGTVTLEYDAPPGMTLEVYREGGELVGTSSGGGGVETVTFTAAFSGPAYAVVTGVAVGPFDARRYQIQVQIEEPACVPDAFEPNDDPLAPPGLMTPAFIDATLCNGDIDFFRVFLFGQPELFVFLDADPAATAAVTFVDESDFTIIQTINGPGDGIVPVPAGAMSLLVVVAGGGETPYFLGIE